MIAKKSCQRLRVGDFVKIIHPGNLRGRIVEERGPLGPGGALIYRVRIPRKPKPTYIELREDQLVAIPTPPQLGPSQFLGTARSQVKPPKIAPKRGARGNEADKPPGPCDRGAGPQ
jgi:hypothetical protein